MTKKENKKTSKKITKQQIRRNKASFELVTLEFVNNIEGLNMSHPLVINFITEKRKALFPEVIKERKEYNSLYRNKADKIELMDKIITLDEKYKEYLMATSSARTVRKSFIVSLVSYYDSLIANIIRAAFYNKKELINSIDKNFKVTKINEFKSINEINDYLVEQEIDDLLRENHTTHIDWINKKLGVSIKEKLDIWVDFIELTERRNLFVHTQGAISQQYLDVCKKNGLTFNKKVGIGYKLSASDDYLKNAYNYVFEMGIIISQLIWRKFKPKEHDLADDFFAGDIIYNLLRKEEYTLAIKLADFALENFELKSRKSLLINKTVAHKLLGHKRKYKMIIKEIKFDKRKKFDKLISAVLKDDFNEAILVMKKIGRTKLSKKQYKDWPLFKDFRKTKEFIETYETIFSEPLYEAEVINKILE